MYPELIRAFLFEDLLDVVNRRPVQHGASVVVQTKEVKVDVPGVNAQEPERHSLFQVQY